MAKYTGADCRLCRREGCKLFLKAARCTNGKCPFDNPSGKSNLNLRTNVPGVHGAGRKKVSEYGIQLREKQKVKRFYGLMEKQFKAYYVEAERRKGNTGETMLSLLETRLDNVVYRMGIGASRAQSRQIVNHAHITVNGKLVNIPSYQVKLGDVISIKEAKQKKFANLKEFRPILPKWVEFDTEKLTGKVIALPTREDIDLTIAEHNIIELYSK